MIRRRRPSSPVPAQPLDDDDLLTEIILRLPRLQPLAPPRLRPRLPPPPPRAPPESTPHRLRYPSFRSVLDPPDLIPIGRFQLRLAEDEHCNMPYRWMLFGCRHGRVLLLSRGTKMIVVWDPDTGGYRWVAVPPAMTTIRTSKVLCAAAADDSHVHGGFSSCRFKVVFVDMPSNQGEMFAACVYSSETGEWSDLISIAAPFSASAIFDPAVLVGHALYWLPVGGNESCILQFDLVIQTLAVIEWSRKPNCTTHILAAVGRRWLSWRCHLSHVCSEGVSKWVLQNTYDQDSNMLLLWVDSSVFMLQLDSLQSKKIWENNIIKKIHPYTSTYITESGQVMSGATTSSRRFSSASRRSHPPSLAPPPSASDGAASSLTTPSSAASDRHHRKPPLLGVFKFDPCPPQLHPRAGSVGLDPRLPRMIRGGEMIRRRRPTSPAPALPLDDDDLLSEILLRLPPQPSSLPRASLVCKRWRRLVSDPGFLRRFRSRHRKPPLLGFFNDVVGCPVFNPTLDPPDRIPAAHLSWRPRGDDNRFDDFHRLLGCHYGRALIYMGMPSRLIVWDPLTSDRRAVGIPGAFHDRSVVYYAGEVRCVDGACHSSPFEVTIIVGITGRIRREAFACVYSSETGNWGNAIAISTEFDLDDLICCFSTMVGNSLYWLLMDFWSISILQINLDKMIIVQIEVPPDVHHPSGDGYCRIAPAEDGGLLLIVATHYVLNLWKSKISNDGVVGWVLEKTIELDRLLSLEPGPEKREPMILGFAGEHNVRKTKERKETGKPSWREGKRSEAEMIRRRCPTSPASAPAPATPLDNDDLLSEILIRLPPQPSSLPRASLVCKRWRRLVSDRGFLRRLRAHHRRPPLLGFFKGGFPPMPEPRQESAPTFIPTLNPPDRIPAACFCWRLPGRDINFEIDCDLFGCRHGRALVYDSQFDRLMVFDPLTGDRRSVDIPDAFCAREVVLLCGEVRCVDGEEGHVHGSCHSSPFEVAVIGSNLNQTHAFACVYSSETGNWGNLISATFNWHTMFYSTSTLVGNSLFWALRTEGISVLQFNLDKEIIAQVDAPPDVHRDRDYSYQMAPAEDDGLIFLAVTHFNLIIWKSKTNTDGILTGWVLDKTIQLDRLLPMETGIQTRATTILGFVEEHNIVFLRTDIAIIMVNLESMQFKSLAQTVEAGIYYPFTSFLHGRTVAWVMGDHVVFDHGGAKSYTLLILMAKYLSRRRAASPATLPDDDDLLTEILLRLPPRPSSLPRASLVCSRWRRLVSDPAFHRRFSARHRNPPLIGVFVGDMERPFFRSVLDPPDLIPTERFRMREADDEGGNTVDRWRLFGCRHGCALLKDRQRKELVLWVPDTGDHRVVAFPREIDDDEKFLWNGAVISADAADDGHGHCGFSSCPFKVVVVGVTKDNTQMFACFYSLETGKWSDLIFIAAQFVVYAFVDPGILAGNALYWSATGDGNAILQFDLNRHSLAVIDWPSNAINHNNHTSQILKTEDGGLGLATISRDSLQLWERKVCSQGGVAEWVLQKTHELNMVLDLGSRVKIGHSVRLGYDEDTKVMLLWVDFSVFMLQLDSLQSKKLLKTNILYCWRWFVHSVCGGGCVTYEVVPILEMNRHRRRAPSPATLPDDDDLLTEILLRLPPRPSSLPRASLVCSRWRRLVSDHAFLRRFRSRHRKPPLLGFFQQDDNLEPVFIPALDPPDRIPASRFSWRPPGPGGDNIDHCDLSGCRHGRLTLFNRDIRHQCVVWDPVTDERRAVDLPVAFLVDMYIYYGSVCRVDGDPDHVHGDCHSSPFELAILTGDDDNAFTCVYSSVTANWGNVISIEFEFGNLSCHSDALVGNSLYWLLQWGSNAILYFDLERQRLGQIDVPPLDEHTNWDDCCQIASAEDGGFLFLVVTYYSLNLWKNKKNGDCFAGWVLEKTIEMDRLLSFGPGPAGTIIILGFSDEHNAVFLGTHIGAFLIYLESMQSKNLSQTNGLHYCPFSSFDTKECQS
uniref:F-box domain-containing protein n=1 Tax=Leersia perrieri TaxID=77586 RepID=A0A0D9XHN2_9ORYZ